MRLRPDAITVVIPSIPPRIQLLGRAVSSVFRQERPADNIAIAVDHRKQGAAVNRQNALNQVDTEWVAFLDDDDELLPEHLRRLHETAVGADADLVYPWFTVVGGSDPFPMHEGKIWNPADPIQFPITYLARTEIIRKAGGFVDVEEGPTHEDGNRAGEDWRLELALVALGAHIVHLPERTWLWHHHSGDVRLGPGNTSGLPSRW